MARKSASAKRTATPRLNAEPASYVTKRLDRLIPLLVAIAGVVAYYNSFRVPFLFDDRYHIVENARIRQLWPPWHIVSHSSRPVLHLSLALNYALGGLAPSGYHLLNLAFHLLAGLVLFGVCRRSFALVPLKPPGAASWLAGAIALIWLVHPIQTESVTYTIQRGESLMGLFYLLTLYCVIRMASSPRPALWTAAAAACLLGGVGTKGGVILTAPVVVLLYDRLFLSGSWKRLAREHWRLYTALVAVCVSYPLMLANAPEEWKESAGFGYGASPLRYAAGQPRVILHYLRLALWPDGFCLDYGWPPVMSAAEVAAPLLVILALLAGTVWAWRRKPGLAFLGSSFFLMLAPTSSFIPIADAAAEHRMYLPLAAVVVGIVAGIYWTGRNRSRTLRWTVATMAILLLTVLTIRRNQDYESKISIWEDTVRKSPRNPRAQYDLAVALEETNRYPEALAHYRLAVEASPKYADALNNLGHLLVATGKAEEALPYLRQALEIKPGLAIAHNSIGVALAQQGNSGAAIAEFQEALRLNPALAEPHSNFAIVMAQQGRTAEAIAEWESALRIDPNLADAHSNLAYALAGMGRNREAMQHYDRALAINPASYGAAFNYAKLLAAADPREGGDLARAAAMGQRACDLTGRRDPDCLNWLSGIYAKLHRPEDAVRTAQTALELAQAAGRQDLVGDLRARLEQYRNIVRQ